MDPHEHSQFNNFFKLILKSKTSLEYENGVLFEYKSKQQNSSSSVPEQEMRYFLDINIDRPSVFTYKGTQHDLESAGSVSQTDQKKSSSGSNDGSSLTREHEDLSMDLDGSPLKLKAYADLSAFGSPLSAASPIFLKRFQHLEKPNYGIKTCKARHLLSLFSTFFTSNKIEREIMPDFWVLCDASDVKSSIIHGVQPVRWEGLVGLRITVVTLTNKDIDLKKEIDLDVSNTSDANYYARYNVIEAMKDDRAGYQGSLAVDLEWKCTTQLLQTPPSHATAIIKASVNTGDMRSLAYSFYQELTPLKSFVLAVTTGDVNWIAEKSDVPLIEIVKELTEKMRQGDRVVPSDKNDDPVNLITLESLVFKERQDYDFTDHLWKVLIGCSAMSDLVASLQYVFTCLSNGYIQPMVQTTNHTTMAQLVRDSYTGRMIAPSLKGVTPIKLLAEMGAEKMKRDYINAFLSSDLTTLSHLSHLVSTTGSLENHVEQLDKQQNVLEMVSMLKLFLSLPHAVLSSSAKQMLKHYQMNAVDEKYVFEFPVPTSSVMSVLETCSPSVWKVRFDHTKGSVPESTVYCLTTFQPFQHVQKLFDTDTRSGDDKHFLIKKEDFVSLL